jgi:(2R)-ethylmalonyl-CoA mutase
MVERSTPWVMRTYSGHSNAVKSNELYRDNLAKGQTGLSIAFDLPTQTGYDPDDPEASGEVGKVGVPIAHLGHMRQLLADIPLGEMNTSMTINATAPWLWGLYLALADEQGVDLARLQGTTQNDIVKEYLSRGTYIFAPEPSKRLIVDMIAFAINNVAKWNPINVCSYHLQEAGATPVQEIAYALATAIDVLDAVRDSGKIEPGQMPRVVGRMSFFVNAGVRFIEEIAKVRTFTAMWDEICRTRYGVQDPSLRRFRYGVQVNSLGLTEQQPENNVQRIVLEMLGVTLSADARARAIQLPAWNEALGLPRPWDQQWSLRVQQVLAFESDLLEYPDIFAGSRVMDAKVRELTLGARGELDDVLALGGAFRAIDELKSRLVASQSERVARIESGEQTVVGVNRFIETAPSPLTGDTTIEPVMTVDPEVERELVADVTAWRRQRDESLVLAALDELARVARSAEPRDNIMVPTIALAKAGGTTGEWANALREVFGVYRTPVGAPNSSSARRPSARVAERRRSCSWPSPASTATRTGPSRSPSPRATPASRSSTRASAHRPRRSSPRRATRTSTSWASRSSRVRTWPSCRASSRGCAPRASRRRSSSGASCPTRTPSCCAARASRRSTRPRTTRSRRS